MSEGETVLNYRKENRDMTKVKVIKLSNFDLGPFDNLENLFEEKVNRFIEDRMIVDIKYQTAISNSGNLIHSAMVIYKED